MLATPTASPPTGPAWAHEVKWDGMRVLADVSAGRVRASARSGADATLRFPELAVLGDAADDVLLDGEVVALDDGIPSFGRLAERMHVGDAATAAALAATIPVTYMVFDVLRVGGHDLRERPWHVRRSLLEQLEWSDGRIATPEVYDDGAALFAATAEAGLEGVVSKRRDSPYLAGVRSRDWLKCAHRPTTSLVVGGWRPESTTGSGLGALLVGVPGPGVLRFAGRVGSGLTGATRARLLPALREAATDRMPFADELPNADVRGTHWVRPELVVDVRSLGRSAGRLRQPVVVGLRDDLSPADLAQEP